MIVVAERHLAVAAEGELASVADGEDRGGVEFHNAQCGIRNAECRQLTT